MAPEREPDAFLSLEFVVAQQRKRLGMASGKWVGDMSIEILYNDQDGNSRSDNAHR